MEPVEARPADSSARRIGSIRPLVSAIADGACRAQALVEEAQENAARRADLNAIAWVDWAAAVDEARRLDAEARSGRLRGPLHGIPVSIKDLYAVRGMPTHAGTRAPLPPLGADEATLVTRLRHAGALVFAKTNMHEIALGCSGENEWTGDVCNPFDPARQSGGSSSGSGVAVATGIGLASIGSDTGGSVRIPAAFCSVVGYKPTYAAIPLDGALPLSWTCDHAGPLARNVDDCVLLHEVMAQRRVAHGGVARRPRLHVPAAWLRGRLAPEVRERFERAVAELRAAGAEIGEANVPQLSDSWRAYTPIVRAEAAWVHRAALDAGGEGFSSLVLPALQAARRMLAVEYVDAMQTRAAISQALDAALAGCDAWILPTSTVLPPLRGQNEVQVEGGTTTVREAVLGQTLPFSLCGVPALSVPLALVDGLPVGLQVVARRDGDATLLALGQWIEATVRTTT
ncbi:MAG: amidase [Burkholderiaceae bacterium]|nr:amidase [Burkholderiaceae bacterium]